MCVCMCVCVCCYYFNAKENSLIQRIEFGKIFEQRATFS